MTDSTNSSTYCPLPFMRLSTEPGGVVKFCGRSQILGEVVQQSIVDIWNNDIVTGVRKDLLNDVKNPVCKKCWVLEEAGQNSLRKQVLETMTEPPIIENMTSDYKLPVSNITELELNLSNLCNLQCRMCNVHNSSQWYKHWKILYPDQRLGTGYFPGTDIIMIENRKLNGAYISAFDNNELFWEQMTEIVPSIKTILFAGGEPLLDPLHMKTLEILIPFSKDITLSYYTNLTEIDPDILDVWNKFKKVKIWASIDSIDHMYEYIRVNANWNKLLSNINMLKEQKNIQIKAAFCLSIYNVFTIPEYIIKMTELNLQIKYNLVTMKPFLSVKALNPVLRQIAYMKLINFERSELQLASQNNKLISQAKYYLTNEYDDNLWNQFLDYTNKLENLLPDHKKLKQIQSEFKIYFA
jgi:MoaA/NifB/PqqE/SkfB family radical SAM enzyme